MSSSLSSSSSSLSFSSSSSSSSLSSSSYSSSSTSSSASSSSLSSSSSSVAPLFPELSHEQDQGYPRETLIDGAVVTAPLGNGQSRTRPEASDAFRGWRCRIDQCIIADYTAFETFYHTTVLRSVRTFRWRNRRTGEILRVRFSKTEPPRWRRVENHQDLWSVEFTLLDAAGVTGSGLTGSTA